MYKHILSINKKYKYLQTSLWDSSFSGIEFLKKEQFKFYRKTIDPKLGIKNIDIVELIKGSKDIFKKYHLFTLQQLTDDKKYNEFLELTKTCYELSHKDNPLVKIPVSTWKNTVEYDLIKELSFVLVDDNRVIAFALMHKNTELTKDLGWRGVHLLYNDEIKEIILALTCKQIERANDADIENLSAEIDSTDIYSTIIHENFPFDKAPVWLTCQANLL